MKPSRTVLLLSWIPIALAADNPVGQISLTVPSGAPLRVYLTSKVTKRADAPVHAKVIEPVFAFDQQVIPAGAEVTGRVVRVDPVSRWQRAHAMMNGDFTPLHRADIEFTGLTLADGRTLTLHTLPNAGLLSIYTPPKPPKKPKKEKPPKAAPKSDPGVLGIGKQTARDQINQQINQRLNAHTHGLGELVRGPNKKERLFDFAMAKLPYHPQWVRRGTRFDAELSEPVGFGAEAAPPAAWDLLGSQPPPDSIVHARLLQGVDSASAALGQTVEAVTVEPLFSPDHKLILPEGTHVSGSVVLARKARWLHRGGRLRFNFLRFDLPEEATALKSVERKPLTSGTVGSLAGAESSGKTPIKVDDEGGVKATESKTRFIAPLISLVVANKAADNDAGRHATSGGEANVSGRTFGGASGFGLLGTAAAQSSKYVGTALGFYGLAFSVYANVLAPGGEVEFARNAAIEIRFGARPKP
jgi:hypothetical protein